MSPHPTHPCLSHPQQNSEADIKCFINTAGEEMEQVKRFTYKVHSGKVVSQLTPQVLKPLTTKMQKSISPSPTLHAHPL